MCGNPGTVRGHESWRGLLAHSWSTQGHSSSSSDQILSASLSPDVCSIHSKSRWLYWAHYLVTESGWRGWGVKKVRCEFQFVLVGSRLSSQVLVSPRFFLTQHLAFLPDCWPRPTATSCPAPVTGATCIDFSTSSHICIKFGPYNKSLFTLLMVVSLLSLNLDGDTILTLNEYQHPF